MWEARNWENSNPNECAEKVISCYRYDHDGDFITEKRILRRMLPQKKDITEPEWHLTHLIEASRAKWYHKWSNRRCRRRVHQMIQKKQYVEAEYEKPIDVTWDIW